VVNVLADTALVRGRGEGMALIDGLSLVRLVAGLMIGLVLLFRLAEHGHRDPPLAAPP
jgi:hypothetical protein